MRLERRGELWIKKKMSNMTTAAASIEIFKSKGWKQWHSGKTAEVVAVAAATAVVPVAVPQPLHPPPPPPPPPPLATKIYGGRGGRDMVNITEEHVGIKQVLKFKILTILRKSNSN